MSKIYTLDSLHWDVTCRVSQIYIHIHLIHFIEMIMQDVPETCGTHLHTQNLKQVYSHRESSKQRRIKDAKFIFLVWEYSVKNIHLIHFIKSLPSLHILYKIPDILITKRNQTHLKCTLDKILLNPVRNVNNFTQK